MSSSSTTSKESSQKNYHKLTADDPQMEKLAEGFNIQLPDDLLESEKKERNISNESQTATLESSTPLTQTNTPVGVMAHLDNSDSSSFRSNSEQGSTEADFASVTTLEALMVKVSTRKRKIKTAATIPLAAPVESTSPHRYLYLSKAAHYFAEILNTGNMPRFRKYIDDAFTPDCLFHTNALPEPIRGRDNIFTLYSSVCRSFPDFVMVVQSYTVSERTISILLDTFGTRIAPDKDAYLYDYLSNNLTDPPPVSNFDEQRQLAETLAQAGRTLGFSSQSRTVLVLNEEKTHFESFTSDVVEVKIFEPSS